MTLADQKKLLRKKMLENRQRLSPEEAMEKSMAAQKYLLDSEIWQNATSVALYRAFKQEVSTSFLLDNAWKTGKKAYLPKVLDKSAGKMKFFLCSGADQLSRGAFGIEEPPLTEEMDVPDLMILPGVAFDGFGHRLGFGGGFYDRFLAGQKDFPRIGLCFSLQIVNLAPHEPNDAPVDALCTDEGYKWLKKLP